MTAGLRRREDGLSLLELLVVIVVMGVVASALLLSADLGGARARHHDDGRALAVLLERMCEEATLLSVNHGMHVAPIGAWFSTFGGEGWLVRDADRLYRLRPFDHLAHVSLRVEGRDVTESDPELPQIICFSSGEMTPFELELVSVGGDLVRLVGTGLGEVSVEQDDDA